MHRFDFPTPWFDNYRLLGMPEVVPTYDKPVFALLDDAAQKYPDRPAIIFEGKKTSYRELKEITDAFAGALRRMGLQTGERVALMLPNIPQIVIAFWGIVKAGGVVVMTNPRYMETELTVHLNDSGAKYMILLDSMWEKVEALKDRLPVESFIVTRQEDFLLGEGAPKAEGVPYGERVHAWPTFAKGAAPYVHEVKDPAKDVIMLQYTGGTTGTPKGVMLTHENLGTNCRQVLGIVKLKEEDRHAVLSVMPIFHVYGLCFGITFPATLGAATIPVPRNVPQEILKIIAAERPTVFPAAPAIYNALLQQKELPNYDISCLQICISGSAPLSLDVFERFQAVTGARIVEGYGLTEASPVTHINPLGEGPLKTNSIGLPLSSTLSRIVDVETGTKTLKPGEIGELVLKGPQVMLGYKDRPEETAETVTDGWLHTGDIATMDEDGYFFILDRKKDMAIVGGYNVYPREVDEILMAHPNVVEAVTVGLPDPMRGESLKAFIVAAKGSELKRTDIISWCRKKLASYKVPRKVEFRESLPKSLVGKILRRKLREEELEKLKSAAGKKTPGV